MTDPDGDPKCSSQISWGGIVPESYYISRPTDVASSTEDESGPTVDDSYILVSIGRGSKESFCVGDVKPGDTLSWEFFTEANDITFSIWVDPVTNSPALESRKANGLDGWLKNGVLNKLTSQKSFESTDQVLNNKSSSLSTSFSFGSALSNFAGNNGNKTWKQVTQTMRVDCDLVPEVGQKKVDVGGVYYMCFDNTYSWTRAKRLWCRTEIHSLDGSATKDRSSVSFQITSEDDSRNRLNDSEDVESIMSAVSKEIDRPAHQTLSGSYLDIDLTALTMVLLRTLPLISRRNRTKLDAVKPTN